MNANELTKLWASIEEVINAPTKKEAKPLVSRLKFQASQIKANINDPYFRNKLDEVIIYAEEASGRVMNKIEAESYVKQSWYTFESGVKTHNKNEETNNLP
ncbi:hypothetical protein [Arcobacter arenosus]|uniref:hypothetical protein n=1 Tax=Arcobacter arenosus TaxID=2576037 RepID=UPI003BAC41BD